MTDLVQRIYLSVAGQVELSRRLSMARAEIYVDLEGGKISFAGLDEDERKLVGVLKRRAKTHPDWNDFDNFWMRRLGDFYDARGLTRKQSRRTAVYEIAQDLSSRLGIAAGLTRLADYRDQLEELIQMRFKSRREFCEATGLSEDMLSHVLAGRKHLAIDTLSAALDRIGYRLQIRPKPSVGSIQTKERAAG